MDLAALRIDFLEELTKVNRDLRAVLDARVKSHGLTLSRARVLMHLASACTATQAELAQALGIEQHTMVGLIDALEKKEFVTRRADPPRRRAKGIFLTDYARAQADELLNFATELREHVLVGVDEKDLMIATRVLQQVALNIGKAAK